LLEAEARAARVEAEVESLRLEHAAMVSALRGEAEEAEGGARRAHEEASRHAARAEAAEAALEAALEGKAALAVELAEQEEALSEERSRVERL
ncbi:hypothetical protein INO08_15365, partial [Staphylococcus aureus]|nr:hypothetical protein [Staphylococcus aureus]